MATEVIKPISTVRNCATAGVAIRVAASSANTDRFCQTAVVQADSANAGNIYIGGSDVTSSNGFILAAGDAINLAQFLDKKRGAVLDLYNFWVVSGSNNDKARVIRSTEVSESEL